MGENKYLQWMTESTKSIYWHDSAIRQEQLEAFSNGAVGMTTNPFLINSTLAGDKDFWKSTLADLPGGLCGDEKVEAFMQAVTGFYAREVRPIFDQGIKGKGYVCAQTNPSKTGDADYMLRQARRLAAWGPNIVVKLPATRAGIETYEECVALGLNVAATVSFTVPQVLAVAQAAENGKKRALANQVKPGLSIAVIMVGRLDDYLRDVAQDSKAEVGEQDIIQAGTACFKRAYQIYRERGYDTVLMPAGCRNADHITDLAGAEIIMSIAPKIAGLLKNCSVFEEKIDVPVDPRVIDRLSRMKEFRKAFEPDGMAPEDFITFGSCNRTTDQFIQCGWDPIAQYPY